MTQIHPLSQNFLGYLFSVIIVLYKLFATRKSLLLNHVVRRKDTDTFLCCKENGQAFTEFEELLTVGQQQKTEF